MPVRSSSFRPVLPLSTGAAVSKTLASIIQRFGSRKDREEQERKDLLAALQLQNLKQKNAESLEQLKSFFRGREEETQFRREAPERAEEKRQFGLETLEGLGGNFDLTLEQMRQAQAGEEITGPLKRKPFRPTTQDRVSQRAVEKENRIKKTTFGGRNLGQLSDDIRSTRQLPLKDEFGDPTGSRGFETPQHKRQHEFNKSAFELRSEGFSDFDLEQIGLSEEEAIRNYNELKGSLTAPAKGVVGPRRTTQVLTKPEIIKLMKAGLTLEMIKNGIATLKRNPKFAKFSDERLLKILLRELNK